MKSHFESLNWHFFIQIIRGMWPSRYTERVSSTHLRTTESSNLTKNYKLNRYSVSCIAQLYELFPKHETNSILPSWQDWNPHPPCFSKAENTILWLTGKDIKYNRRCLFSVSLVTSHWKFYTVQSQKISVLKTTVSDLLSFTGKTSKIVHSTLGSIIKAHGHTAIHLQWRTVPPILSEGR